MFPVKSKCKSKMIAQKYYSFDILPIIPHPTKKSSDYQRSHILTRYNTRWYHTYPVLWAFLGVTPRRWAVFLHSSFISLTTSFSSFSSEILTSDSLCCSELQSFLRALISFSFSNNSPLNLSNTLSVSCSNDITSIYHSVVEVSVKIAVILSDIIIKTPTFTFLQYSNHCLPSVHMLKVVMCCQITTEAISLLEYLYRVI